MLDRHGVGRCWVERRVLFVPRAVVVLLAVVLLICVSAGGQGENRAFLGELVPWPILPSALLMIQLELEEVPAEAGIDLPLGFPVAIRPLYGLVPLGSGDDPGVTLAIFENGTPRLWVDTNNDEQLTLDEFLHIGSRIGLRAYSWSIQVMVEYSDGERLYLFPYQISVVASYSYTGDRYEVRYSTSGVQRGLIQLAGRLYPIAIMDLSQTARYDDPSQLLVAVDTDGDGRLNNLPGSHEVYFPSAPLRFQVGETLYEITDVSVDGRYLTVQPVGYAKQRPVIAPGHFAPDFETQSPDDRLLPLSDYRDSVVVLAFLPDLKKTRCPTCDPVATRSSDRFVAIRAVLEEVEGDVVLIIITNSYSYPLPEVQTHSEEPQGLRIETVLDSLITELYRRTEGVIIVDQAGKIAAMDQWWYSEKCGEPRGKLEQLHAEEVRAVVARLLEQGGE